MRRYALILTAAVLSVTLVADGSFAQRGGRGGGGGRAGGGASVNRSPSMSRPSAPSASRPSAPSTRPSTPSRPSAGHVDRPRRAALGWTTVNTPFDAEPSFGRTTVNTPFHAKSTLGRAASVRHVPGPEPGHVPRLRAPAPVPASIATRSRAGSAPAPDSSPRCPTGSSRVRRSCPAHVPRRPTASQLPARPGSGEGWTARSRGPGRPEVPAAETTCARSQSPLGRL